MATEQAEILRPAPDRGEATAAAAIALTLLVFTLLVRFEGEWGRGIHLVISALAAAAVIGCAAMSPRTGERPAAWQSVLFICSFVLALITLANLADVLGADDPFSSSGTIVWIGLLLTALMHWFSRAFDSGISTFLTAVSFAAVVLAFVDWVFTPDGVDTFRWILVLIAIAYGVVGWMRRDDKLHHANGFVNTAGLALVALGMTFVFETVFGAVSFGEDSSSGLGANPGEEWELAMIIGAALLIAYSVITRQAGPGYLGAINLFLFVFMSATPGEDGPSLIGWPLALIFIFGALAFLAFRPNGGPPRSEAPTAVQPPPAP